MTRLHIKNGRIVDPANEIDEVGDVFVVDGKIVSVISSPDNFSADRVIDADNRIVCPAFIDLCARMREPGQEHKGTIASETHAAVSSGISTICYPPDTQPVIDTPAVAELIQQRAQQVNKIRIFPLGALTVGLQGQRLTEMLSLKRAGCVGVSNASTNNDNTDVLKNALAYARSCDMTVFLQVENTHLSSNGVAHDGAISTRLGLSPIPETAETIAISQALLLIEDIGGPVHFGRLSSARSVALIAEAKKSGLPVSADVGICHLHLSEMDVDGYNSDCHLRPPLRSQRDREALCQAITSGAIDAICSDHQPHDNDAKAAPFAETEAGASTIELLLPLVMNLVRKKIFSLQDAIAALSCRPAAVLKTGGGSLSPGLSADIAIIDPEQHFSVEENHLISAGKNNPFVGWELVGAVTHTIFEGELVYQSNISS
ncbi:MAG: dihydroorotase [Gammaproteobacteria bacterium]|nr:dihydroorotase [Gammaproteobacteria bacterium]